uniref:CCHC-type domain-containing protein n=1 Tax=Tanacetum cinerariifolium TaxID=118510 RepID=A0A699JAL6_TANCI|nr:hypothetical protein [Tanacetum cinerariifolium]
MNPRGRSAAGYGEAYNRVGNVNQGQARLGQARTVKCYNCNGIGHIARNYTQPKRPQNSEYFKDKMLLMQAQENGVALDAEQLLFLAGGPNNAFDDDVDEQPVQDLALNVDNVFQAEDCDAFDSNVDEAPTAQTMFNAYLSSADPITDEAGPYYDSDILSKVQDHDQYLDDTCAYQEEHVMHDSVQLDHVVELHTDYTSVCNMIPYDQEHVELYERRAKFELTKREQKINEQLRLVISDRNFKEETLKRELHSTKLQLTSTINRNKSIVEERTFLKQDFKQKENKLLADFLNMKSLKEKVEDRLVKQDQSLQTVHMLCRPRPLCNDLNKVAISYKNPLCLTRAKQAQPALYNGHEILKDNHALAKVHNAEDTLEIAEITRKKMNAKMTDPECMIHKVKIAPHDYTKENFLATFTPQKQLTPEQIYWSNDLMKLKSEALKERAKRITPTSITDGERGFEQTKACYLQEVIPFFKTIKENFEGIQKALTKEVKEMKDVFEELEAEVAQCAVDRNHDAIDLKNLLIANDNLIVECLSKEVFSVATKSELNVARLAEMYVANTSVEARCLALEAELATLSSLQGKDNVICQLKKQLSQLQVNRSDTDRTLLVQTTDSQITKLTDHVTQLQAQNNMFRAENDKIKQHYKELYDSIKITRAKHIEQVTKLTAKNVMLKASVSKDKVQPPVLTRTKHAVDVEPIVPCLRSNRDAHLDYLRHLKESVEIIRDIVEEANVVRPLDRSIVSACRYIKHSQELLEYAIGTCPQGSQQRAKQLANTPLIRKKQVTIAKPSDRQDNNKQVHVVAVKPCLPL